jgi:hypothetical protein
MPRTSERMTISGLVWRAWREPVITGRRLSDAVGSV